MTHTPNQNPYDDLKTSEEVQALFLARVSGTIMAELRLAYPGGSRPQHALLAACRREISETMFVLLQSLSMTADFYDRGNS